jgi:single-strand DNA-binding protein
MAYELSGKIKVIQSAQVLGAKGFTKREFVVTVEDGKYPQDIALECVQDKVKLLDGLKEGQTVAVTFDIRGREYNGRYFNNLQAWRIKAEAERQSADGDDHDPIPSDAEAPDNADDDEIPF